MFSSFVRNAASPSSTNSSGIHSFARRAVVGETPSDYAEPTRIGSGAVAGEDSSDAMTTGGCTSHRHRSPLRRTVSYRLESSGRHGGSFGPQGSRGEHEGGDNSGDSSHSYVRMHTTTLGCRGRSRSPANRRRDYEAMTPLPTDQATTFRPFQPSSPSADRVSGFAGGNRSLVSRTRRSSRPCCDDDGAVVKPSGSERCKGDDDDLSHVSGGKCSTVCRDGGKKHHPSSPTPSRTRPENGTSRVVACVGDAGRKDHSVTSLSYRGGRGCGNPSPSQNTLSLTFNGITFSTLSGVLEHAKDYSVGGERIRIFLKIINQATSIMQLNSDFAKGLVSGIQKDPSWKMEKFSEKDVKELLEPLARQVQMAAVRQDRRKGALSTINRLWGAEVTGFLQQNTKSETCIRQIAHFATRPQISSYVDARRTVNEFVVERLISGRSRQSSRFDTTTADWIAVDKADPPSHDIPYDRLLAAGVHLGRFGEIIKGPPPIRLRSPRPLSGCVGCQDGSAQKNPSNISAGPEVGDLSRSACGKKGSRKKGLVNKSAGPDPGGDGNADNGEAKSGSSGVEDDDSSSGDDDDSDVANLPHPSSRQPSPEAPGLDILKFSSSGLGFLEAKELFDEWSL